MSTITVLGGARRGCSGPTRRETLKVGALSLLGGLFNTASLLALEKSGSSYVRPAGPRAWCCCICRADRRRRTCSI